jgi:hypothetical protein
MTSRFLTISFNKYPFSGRALIFVGATLLLHLLAFQSATWKDWSINEQPSAEKMITVQLRTTPPAEATSATTPKPDQAISKSKPKEKSNSLNGTNQDATAIIETSPEKVDTVISSGDEQLAETTSEETIVEKLPQEIISTPEPAKYAVRAPESVRIEMELIRTKPDTSQNHGVGSIDWTVKDGKYSMSIEAGLDLLIASFNLYKLTSEGRLDKFGITPEMSTETRRTRASTATHFHHDDKTISFSSSSKIVVMSDGAQDKASFLMQLASIGYADEKQFYAGKEIELQVAEERDASLFHFLVIGKEEINTKLGKLSTWHLLRAPKPGTYNSQLDIWLAPALGWYPVQIRNTEKNGTITEQTVTKLTQKFNLES